MTRLSLHELEKTEVLAGSANGAAALSRLVSHLSRVSSPTVVVLDFGGVEVATGSFLRECVLGFRDFCRRSQQDLYPVGANLNDLVEEELLDLLQKRREALVVCTTDARGRLLKPRVIGVLEEKERITFDAVAALGEADAGTLEERFGEGNKDSVTKWNNRLASLAAGGILMEIRRGRAKIYRPVLEGLERGT